MPKLVDKNNLPGEKLLDLVTDTLDDLKAESVVCLDVRHLTTVTDVMVIASGRSARHVRAIAEELLERCKKHRHRPLGTEGQDSGEWVLIDLADVVVHVMLPKVREFYELEKLWDIRALDEAEESS